MTPLLLLGCGKMGRALLNGWVAADVPPSDIHIVDPGLTEADRPHGCAVYETQADLPHTLQPLVTVLAIKPQLMADVLPDYAPVIQSSLIISIAAGKDIAFFESIFGAEAPIVRVMPNTPAAVGRGISAMVANTAVSEDQKNIASQLLSSVGHVVWLDTEDHIDIATAVSGSGPAYVFHLIEAMTAAGMHHGLSPEIAQNLARTTVCGAGELAWHSTEDAATLRQNVTSKGGTTYEALQVLMQSPGGLTDLMTQAVAANIRRSKELARES